MTKREEILEVYRHKNTGYVPCFFTDMDVLKPAYINERPEGKDGQDWFGVEWEYVPAAMAPMVKPGTQRLTDITKWKEEVIFPDLDAIDPLQISNPARKMKDAYQDRITFVGGYDVQNVFDACDVTEEKIRAKTIRVIEEMAPGGSFIAFPMTLTFDFVPIFIDEHYKHAFSYRDK